MAKRRLGTGWVCGFLITLLGATPAFAVCGDGVVDAGEPCDDGNDVANDACSRCRLSCPAIAESLTDHTCGHGASGPFVDVAAQKYPGAIIYGDVSASHTYFNLTLSGDPGGNQSAVLYSPAATTPHAFYMKSQYPLSVHSGEGDEMPLLFEQAVTCGTPESLGSVTWVKVYELRRDQVYTVVVGPVDKLQASVCIEAMAPSIPRFWNRDGDEFGGALAGMQSCEYGDDPTLTTNVSGDCNDDDPTVHPGAAEACDGTDSDCSGDDDAGDEGLCGEEEAGAACVAAAKEVRCGCDADADCGGNATCDVDQQRCVSSGAGGSGEGGQGNGGDSASAGQSSEPSGGTATAGSSSGKAGSEPSSGAADRDRADDGSGNAPAESDGCSYRAGSGGSSSSAALLLAAVALGTLGRRRSVRSPQAS